METYTPRDAQFDFAPRPGRLLQRELDAQSVSQAQLAARTGLSPKHINLVIKGTAAISADVAVTLEDVLGTSAETWLRLEAAHQAQQARDDRRAALFGFVDWADGFPRSVLIDRGVIDQSDSAVEGAAKLLTFFGVANPLAFERTWLAPQASFKRSQLLAIDMNLTSLWLRLSELKSVDLIASASEFDPDRLRLVARQIPNLTKLKIRSAFRRAQKLLLEAGVVLVFVPEMPNTRISGVSRWVDGKPMVAVTSRYKSLDSLWFTILHEIAHVLLHPKRSTFVDGGTKADDNADAQEAAANKFAADHLIPPKYQAALEEIVSVDEIRALANELDVSPSVIAGQWAFRTKVWGGPIAKLREKIDLAEQL